MGWTAMLPEDRNELQDRIARFFLGELGEPYTNYTLVGRQRSERQVVQAYFGLYMRGNNLEIVFVLTEDATRDQGEMLAILAGCKLEPGIAPGPYVQLMQGTDDFYAALLRQSVLYAQAQVLELGLPAALLTIATVDLGRNLKVTMWYPPMSAAPDHLLEMLQRTAKVVYGT